jgi:hypothetical protein
MTALNVVRFRVKPGCQQPFIDIHRNVRPGFKGFLGGDLIQTGEQTFCMVGKWRSMKALVDARPEMIGILDQLRDLLEDLGGDLGVTDPASGESVASFEPAKAAAKGKGGKKGKAKKKGKGKKKSKGKGKKKPKKSTARKSTAKKSKAKKSKRKK